MWQKGGGIICHGIEGEEEKEADDRDIDPDYKATMVMKTIGIQRSWSSTQRTKKGATTTKKRKMMMDILQVNVPT